MIKKLKAFVELYLLVFILFAFILVIGIYGGNEMKKMNESTQTLYEDRVLPLKQLTDLRFNFQSGIIQSAEQVHSSLISYKEAEEKIAEAEKMINTNWKAYTNTLLTNEEGQLIKEVSLLMKRSDETISKLKTGLQTENTTALNNLIHNELYATVGPVVEKLNQLVTLQIKVSKEVRQKNIDRYHTALRKFSVLILLSLLLGIPFAYYLARNIKGLINNLEISNTKIKNAAEKYSYLFHNSPGFIIIWDLETLGILEVNKAVVEKYGYTEDEWKNMSVLQYRPKEDYERIKEFAQKMLNGEVPVFGKIWTHVKKNGTEMQMEIASHKIIYNGRKAILSLASDVTEKINAENAFKKSEEKFHSLVDHAADAIFMVADNGVIFDVNRKATELLGYSKEELIGMNALTLHPERVKYAIPKLWDRLRRERSLTDERIIQRKDGSEVEVEISRRMLPDGSGAISIVRDITGRKSMEAELKEQKEQLQLFVEHSPASLAMLDNEMKYIATSKRWLTDYNIMDKQVIGKSHYEVFPEIPQHWKDIHQRCLNGAIERNDEDGFLRADGNMDWLKWEIRPWHKATGEIGGIIMFTEVITKQKKVTELFRHQFLNSPDIIVIIDKNFKIESINRTSSKEITVESVLGKDAFEVLPEESREMARDGVTRCFQTGEMKDIENKLRFDKWVRSRFVPITINGNIQYVMVIATDITERKKAEDIVQQSEANHRQLFDLSPVPMWVVDEETYRFIQVNKACINTYGYSEDEFSKMTIENIYHIEKETVDSDIAKKQYHQSFSGLHRHIKKSGETIEVEVSSTPILLNGRMQILVIALDVTEKNLYEKKLMKAAIKVQEEERFEIGGELHDNVCQILATSMITLGMIKNNITPESKPYYEQTDHYIRLAAQEIRNLSHQLAPAFNNDVTLEGAFNQLLSSFNVGEKYEVVLRFDEFTNKQTFNQELQLNLYRILQEQLRNILKYANATTIKVEMKLQKDVLKMTISDNGKGFDLENKKSGIGFANMGRRAKLFSGNFIVKSAIGKGCEVEVDIPVSELI